MNRASQIITVSVAAVVLAAFVRHHEEYRSSQVSGTERITESVKGGATPRQLAEISEHGLAAINDIHLARLSINDGQVERARKLLAQSRTLLDQVKSEDRPVSVTTDVRVGHKKVHQERDKERLNLIPIMARIAIVEGFENPSQQASGANSAGMSSGQQPNQVPTPAEQAQDKSVASVTKPKAKGEAIAQAREHLRHGDPEAAAKALRLADLALVSHLVSMPLDQTSARVDSAIKLVHEGKMHDANIELKKAQEGLVVTTAVLDAPVPVSSGSAAHHPS